MRLNINTVYPVFVMLLFGCAHNKIDLHEFQITPVYYEQCHKPIKEIDSQFKTENVPIFNAILGGIFAPLGALPGVVGTNPVLAYAGMRNITTSMGLGTNVYARAHRFRNDEKRLEYYKNIIDDEIEFAVKADQMLISSVDCYVQASNDLMDTPAGSMRTGRVDEIIAGLNLDLQIIKQIIQYLSNIYLEYLTAVNSESEKMLSPDWRKRIQSAISARTEHRLKKIENKFSLEAIREGIKRAEVNPNFFNTDKRRISYNDKIYVENYEKNEEIIFNLISYCDKLGEWIDRYNKRYENVLNNISTINKVF